MLQCERETKTFLLLSGQKINKYLYKKPQFNNKVKDGESH